MKFKENGITDQGIEKKGARHQKRQRARVDNVGVVCKQSSSEMINRHARHGHCECLYNEEHSGIGPQPIQEREQYNVRFKMIT